MKIRKVGPIVVAILVPTLLFALLLAGSAGADQPEAPSNAPPVPVPYLINYQGRLLDDTGAPINGTVNLIFRIYADPSGGMAIWEEGHNGVSVSDGYFDALLGETTSLGQNYFIGDNSLYLEVVVNGETLSPRQRIASVAYAIVANTLVPGAEIEGEPAAWDGGVLRTNMTGFYPSGKAMWGSTATGSAVYGEATTGDGLRGYSETGYAVYGYDGGTDQARGYGGYFTSNNGVGVYGYSGADLTANNAYAPGVYGRSANGFGVYGVGNAPWVAGVRGESTNGYGVSGWSTDGYGVYGRSENDYGGYFYSQNYRGLYADGSVYGLYTPDRIYVGGKIDLVGTVDPIIGERFQVDPDVNFEVGDLLVIDPDTPYLQLSSEPNDTRVIGVVGPTVDVQNGELMVVVFGFQGAQPQPDEEGNVPPRSMAFVKADATYGPIHRGDLLTTSPTPGHAMRAQPVEIGDIEIYRPGTIIGKALESLESGQGLIQVFVALQ